MRLSIVFLCLCFTLISIASSSPSHIYRSSASSSSISFPPVSPPLSPHSHSHSHSPSATIIVKDDPNGVHRITYVSKSPNSQKIVSTAYKTTPHSHSVVSDSYQTSQTPGSSFSSSSSSSSFSSSSSLSATSSSSSSSSSFPSIFPAFDQSDKGSFVNGNNNNNNDNDLTFADADADADVDTDISVLLEFSSGLAKGNKGGAGQNGKNGQAGAKPQRWTNTALAAQYDPKRRYPVKIIKNVPRGRYYRPENKITEEKYRRLPYRFEKDYPIGKSIVQDQLMLRASPRAPGAIYAEYCESFPFCPRRSTPAPFPVISLPSEELPPKFVIPDEYEKAPKPDPVLYHATHPVERPPAFPKKKEEEETPPPSLNPLDPANLKKTGPLGLVGASGKQVHLG